jgi:hypothetical protein
MMIIQVGGNRLARVVADDRHAAAGLASCRNEFRCAVGGLSCRHCLDFEQGQLPLGTLANVSAASGYGPKDFQRIGNRTDLGRYCDT